MNLVRLLRHRWLDESHARRVLGSAALDRLETQVRESEQTHTGEICLCVEAGLPLGHLWRDASARERAVAMFGALRVWDTEDNNGVLIYLLLADHAIEIIADRGLAARVPPEHWSTVTADLGRALRSGEFESGLAFAIEQVSRALREHFPLSAGQRNPDQLPNRAVIR